MAKEAKAKAAAPKKAKAKAKAKPARRTPLLLAAAVALAAAGVAFWRLRPPSTYLPSGRFEAVPCAKDDQRSCSSDACGRLVIDDFASAAEVDEMLALARRGMTLGGGAGGPTILDLHSGALSRGDKFVDVWALFNLTQVRETFGPAFSRADVAVYGRLVDRVRETVAARFGLSAPLHLTAPTFFARISGDKPPVIENDEYWHSHIDTLQYGSFAFTTLLYLSDGGGADFDGGRFTFDEAHGRPLAHVAPRRGRLVLFSSGAEFPHRVEQVTRGERFAVTIAFTCRAEDGIDADFLARAL